MPIMPKRVAVFTSFIAALAAVGTFGLYVADPYVASATLRALLLLTFLALVAETLGLVLPNSARASLAFIPYLASVIVSPNWAAVAAIAIVRAIADVSRRIE